MLPKKIYLNYVDEADEDKTWSEEPISVYDCKMQNREYTDLSQLWHLPSELPDEREVAVITKDYKVLSGDFYKGFGVFLYTYFIADWDFVIKWAYLEDFLTLMIPKYRITPRKSVPFASFKFGYNTNYGE